MVSEGRIMFTTVDAELPKDMIGSVVRALDILELLSHEQEGLNPKEISDALNLNLSTCYHQLNTLKAKGYITKHPKKSRYLASGKIGYAANGQTSAAHLVKQLRPHVRALKELSGETSYLSLWDGTSIYIAAISESSQSIQVKALTLGYSEDNHAMAIGKAILAYFDEATLNRYLAQKPLHQFTTKTLTTRAALNKELSQVRQKSYSLDIEERLPNVCCIGAPVFDAAQNIAAAVAITVPNTRFDSHFEKLLNSVRAIAEAASRSLSILDYVMKPTKGCDTPPTQLE